MDLNLYKKGIKIAKQFISRAYAFNYIDPIDVVHDCLEYLGDELKFKRAIRKRIEELNNERKNILSLDKPYGDDDCTFGDFLSEDSFIKQRSEIPENRVCYNCKELKPEAAFNISISIKKGKTIGYCKNCHNEKRRIWETELLSDSYIRDIIRKKKKKSAKELPKELITQEEIKTVREDILQKRLNSKSVYRSKVIKTEYKSIVIKEKITRYSLWQEERKIKCTKCNQEKEPSAFPMRKLKSGIIIPDYNCKSCRNIQISKSHKKKPLINKKQPNKVTYKRPQKKVNLENRKKYWKEQWESNKEFQLNKSKMFKKAQRENLTDYYIKEVIRVKHRNKKIKTDITQEMIDLERQSIKNKRNKKILKNENKHIT